MSSIVHVSDYSPKSGETFFFDNNIWLSLYYPLGDHAQRKQEVYSKLLSRILNLKCAIFINSLIVSEFLNTCIRADFKIWERRPENNGKNYKIHYVGTPDYRESVGDAIAALQQIIKITTPGSDNYTVISLEHVLQGMPFRDFNDNYYLQLAINRKYTLITDDSDFLNIKNPGITIVTARKI